MPTEPLRHTYAGRCPGSQARVTLDAKCPACRASLVLWVCLDPDGRPVEFSVAGTRAQSQECAVQWCEDDCDFGEAHWKYLYAIGWRCIKILAQPVEAVVGEATP